MASMGPYMEGEAVEYIGFLKEAYKYRLHSLLWNNQDSVASYAASTRYDNIGSDNILYGILSQKCTGHGVHCRRIFWQSINNF